MPRTLLFAVLLAAPGLVRPAAAQTPLPDTTPAADTLRVAEVIRATSAVPAAGSAPAPIPDRWKVGMDLMFTGTSGNESLVVLSTGGRVTHLAKKDFELEAAVSARYGRSGGAEVARSLKGSLKFDLHPEARWSPFVFVQAERDPFRKLDVRAGGGAGAKYTVVKSKRAELSFSGAALYSYEAVQASEPGVDPLRRDARGSWRALVRGELPSGFRFEQITFYQPLLHDAGDFLLEAKTSARARVTRSVAVTLSHSYQHDSTPPPQVLPSDHRFETGLIVEF
jgi:hypothetical protein